MGQARLALIALALAGCKDAARAPERSPVPLDPRLKLAWLFPLDQPRFGASDTIVRVVNPDIGEADYRKHLELEGAHEPIVEPIADGFDARAMVGDRTQHLVYRTVNGRGLECQTMGNDDAAIELARLECLAMYPTAGQLAVPFALSADPKWGVSIDIGDNASLYVKGDQDDAPDGIRDVASGHRIVAQATWKAGWAVIVHDPDFTRHEYRVEMRATIGGVDVQCSADDSEEQPARRMYAACRSIFAP